MKTTQAILKSQDLLLSKYNKHNIIYIEIIPYWRWQFVWKKRKNTKSQFWSYISTLKKVENISPLNTTISVAPDIPILVEKNLKI